MFACAQFFQDSDDEEAGESPARPMFVRHARLSADSRTASDAASPSDAAPSPVPLARATHNGGQPALPTDGPHPYL